MLNGPAWRQGALAAILRFSDHPAFLLLVVGTAFVTTMTASMPFAVVIVAATLLSPQRWPTLALAGALGSGAGGAALFEFFHHWGWAEIIARFPELAATSAFATASRWLAAWGLPALALIAASPLPQTPALFLCAIGDYSFASVLLAVFAGKLLKYLLLAWLTATFPRRLAILMRLRP